MNYTEGEWQEIALKLKLKDNPEDEVIQSDKSKYYNVLEKLKGLKKDSLEKSTF